jgi:hypothetical protein
MRITLMKIIAHVKSLWKWFKDNPGETNLTKQQEAEQQKVPEKTFLKIGLFDCKMIAIASSAMVFSIICGKNSNMLIKNPNSSLL